MFIEQSIKPQNKFWKYLVGSLIIFSASVVGQFPLLIAIVVKTLSTGKAMPTSNDELLGFLDLNLTLFLLLLSFAVALLGIILVVRGLHRQKLKEIITSRSAIDIKRVLFAFFIWFVFSCLTTIISYFADPESYVLQFDAGKFIPLLLIAVLMVPIQTSVEELCFRGYLMQGFGGLARNRWFPLVITSVIFGVMHIANPEVEKMGYLIMVYYIGTGFFLGIMTLMDEGMELALGFHAANNLSGVLLVTADWTAFKTYSVFKDVSEPSVGLEILLPVLVVFPILLFIFSKVYKWTNWKEKLTGKVHLQPQEQVLTQTELHHD